ncbi:hypothetical protein P152DRAFT_481273 [Eremomyces bilateralis CBS 781.70]|uniref:Cytochrome P450 n=1 Tax=Eremomyces bilateralis CBS 781.70 TaxID=1392243 RepID=A0A6G1G552_9PEZI|nr:uncharacterized protein P152DRAFT_481273 [Eremomyces bilateralis CBS 781.70]KAF1813132.1 hypothetical protein P152DRAFT_481273 [Eremomyces bilateralis CBS 781.70]
MAVSLYAIAISVIAILLITRWITGSRVLKSNENRPPLVPFWVPFVGNAVELILFPERFLDYARTATFEKGYFALLLLGRKLNVIYQPDIAYHLLSQTTDGHDAQFDFSSVSATVRRNAFGLQKLPDETMERILRELRKAYIQNLKGHGEDTLLSKTLGEWSQTLPDLMSFNDSLVDQMPWERASKTLPLVEGKENTESADTNLFALIQSFVMHTVLQHLFGVSFPEAVPTLQEDIQMFSNAFLLLSLGLPRWAPIPRVTSAHIARHRMLNQLTSYHLAVARYRAGEDEPSSSEWRDVSDVSELVESIHRTMFNNVSPNSSGNATQLAARAAASESLLLIWSISCKLSGIIYWTLFRIVAIEGLADRIRSGSSKVVIATQPPPLMSMYPPPRLNFMVDDVFPTSPLLASSILESFRVYARSWLFRQVRKTTTFPSKGGDRSSQISTRSGELVAIPVFMSSLGHSTSTPKRHWVAERFEEELNDPHPPPFNEGFQPSENGKCPGIDIAQSGVAAFVAGFLSLWDITPVDNQGHQLPKPTQGLCIPRPRGDTRVRISKRNLPIAEF